MAKWLNTTDASFEADFAAVMSPERSAGSDVRGVVADIISRVQSEGDAALMAYTQRFDRFAPSSPAGLRLSAQQIKDAVARVPDELMQALKFAHDRIEAFHKRQMPEGFDYTDAAGVRLGQRWTAVDSVGLYVPGGTANYPSSVLMNVVPARVAGVKRLVITVPTPDGVMNDAVLAAAHIAGVDEIYTVGGAQAIAALAYGTETIAPVSTIVGPGNAFVAEAKRQVFGHVGIDSVAGPSEILVISDSKSDPSWIAADLLSQAEHDAVAQSVLVTPDADFAAAVEVAVEAHLSTLERSAIARESWQNFGAIIITRTLEEAAEVASRYASEHVELAVDDPDALLPLIRHAGAIFLGRHTPEAIGDYVAGPNHVLPTSGSARHASGLGVYNFIKRTTLAGCTPASLAAIGPMASRLAVSEGLGAHALSVDIRLSSK